MKGTNTIYSPDLLRLHDPRVHVNLIILDFTKTFDTMPHESLLGKLKYYGIDSNTNQWDRDFLTKRSQEVMVDGNRSDQAAVTSGCLREQCWALLLFLLHINDLLREILSSVRIFVDDCLLYRALSSRVRRQKSCNVTLTPYIHGVSAGACFNVKIAMRYVLLIVVYQYLLCCSQSHESSYCWITYSMAVGSIGLLGWSAYWLHKG